MKCFYHNDLDGRASAFCVHAWAGLHDPGAPYNDNAFIPMDYGKSIRDHDIGTGEQIWIVDFSIPPTDMLWLLERTRDVTWIDHHKSAVDAYAGFPHEIAGVRRLGEAACVLTFKYLHWYSKRGDEPLPQALWAAAEAEKAETYPVPLPILCTGDRDVWAFERGDETRDFCAAAEAEDTAPDSEFWWSVLYARYAGPGASADEGTRRWEELLERGRAIRRYCEHRGLELRDSRGWFTEFHGHKALACNAVMGGSELMGGDAGFDLAPLLIRYEHGAKGFTVSLYSKTVDCQELAKLHGGGGHRGAAGFMCQTLPFNPEETRK